MLRRSQVPSIATTARQAEEPPSQHVRLPRRRLAQAWRQPGVVLVCVLSDALLAVPVWLVAFELQRVLGRWNLMGWEGYPRTTAMVVGIFAVAVWIGLRSLMGLYPGYGLSSAERLRRHTYSVVGAAVRWISTKCATGPYGSIWCFWPAPLGPSLSTRELIGRRQ